MAHITLRARTDDSSAIATASSHVLLISDRCLEALKYLAALLMLLDHINKFLYQGSLPMLYELGRIAMPLFGFALAYNLARDNVDQGGLRTRMMNRLALFGSLASPMFVYLVGWWPLNIMFTLLLVVAIIHLLEQKKHSSNTLAVLLFVVAGAWVEFWWFGVSVCLTAYAYCRKPTAIRFTGWAATLAALYLVNQNLWALAVLPIVLVAPHLSLKMPRIRWGFYGFYPAHLMLIAAIYSFR